MTETIDNNIKDYTFSADVLKDISSFLNLAPRYKFVFVRCADKLSNIPIINIGQEVASFIHDNEHSDLKAECYNFIKNLISSNTQISVELGKYAYLTNIGILFEPEIGLDVELFLKNISRNTILFLDWNGEFKYPYFHFLRSDSKNKINLSQLNYVTI